MHIIEIELLEEGGGGSRTLHIFAFFDVQLGLILFPAIIIMQIVLLTVCNFCLKGHREVATYTCSNLLSWLSCTLQLHMFKMSSKPVVW